MELPPDHYVDTVPCDKEPLTELGRVSWAAARLHAGVRDAIDRHDGAASDEPFTKTLGQAVKMLETRARQAIGTVDHSPPRRFLSDELRVVTMHLIHASMTLPA